MENYCSDETETRDHDGSYYSPASSDSETDGDDLDGDEDIDIRKNIKPILNLGQTITALWTISLIEHAENVEQDLNDLACNSQPLSRKDRSGSIASGNLFETKHRRAPSLPSQYKLDEIKLKLDEIELDPNEEYGFNHKRAVRGRQKCGRNSVSLYSSNERINDIISLSNPNQLSEFFLATNNLILQSKSLASNAKEIKIEEEIALLRAQPSKVEFSRKNEAKKNFLQIMSRRSQRKTRHRSRSLKRRLSFDSHPRRRAFSDTENLVNKGTKNSSKRHDLNDLKNTKINFPQRRDLSPKKLVAHFGSVPEISENSGNIKLAPPPVIEDKTILEVLVSNAPNNPAKEKRRKASIPQFFNALKLPNKKAIKKFMRRKNDRQRNPVMPNIPAPFPSEGEPQPSSSLTEQEANKENFPTSPSVNTFDRSIKMDGSSKTDGSGDKRSRGRRFFSNSGSVKKISCSTCSLQKVEEDKESSKFDGTLTRKSCSTCSIVAAKFFGGAKEENIPVLERRMSDTALTWKGERRPSCSPGRRFILRLLSPVVCGLSNEKYSNFESCESYASLTSCGSDLSIEAEFLSQKLSDFNAQNVAEELALIDKELLIRITWQELANCGWMSIDKFITSPNVMNMVEFFNRVAMMVESSILAEDSVYLRAKIISKMIKLADKCRMLKNYNSLRAVLGGLQCTPIFRLEATWKQVRARRKRLFSDLSNLMGETENFACYRDELARSLKEPPCLPFLGDFLTQIAQTQAYLAVQRKRSFTKQRLEKASVSSVNNKGSAMIPSSPLHKQGAHERNDTGDNSEMKNSDTKICNSRINSDLTLSQHEEIPEIHIENKKLNIDFEQTKIEKNLECIGDEEKNKNVGLNIDETDTVSDSNSKEPNKKYDEEKHSGLFYFDVNNLKSRQDLIDLHELVLGSSSCDNDGMKTELNKADTTAKDPEEILFPHTFIGTDDKFLESSTDYLECPELLSDNSVFVNDDPFETTSTPVTLVNTESHEFSFSENPRLRIDLCSCEQKSSPDVFATTNKKPECFNCKDFGVGSSSSYEASPQRNKHELTTNHDSSGIVDGENDGDKRTHNRCDSNDSGVVLHNGRTSRASDELNSSRDNLDMIEECNDNSAFEDSKISHEVEVIVENSLDTTDNNTKNAKDSPRNENFLHRKAELLHADHIEETRKLEEMIRKGKPTEEEAKIQKEYQFWQYQIAAMQYSHSSNPSLRKFLLNACYNSEEENYSLSLKLEPITKKVSR